jgi:peptide chain release factor 2
VAQAEMRRLGELKANLDTWNDITQSSDDLAVLLEMSADEPSLLDEIESELGRIREQLDTLELKSALDGPHDASNAILVIHSGEGGIDAQDWASMLARMYVRWGERAGLKVDVLDSTPGEEAGVKNTTVEVKGPNAYGRLKGEGGSHRLVRLSPFDSAHRRHTAFALVEVIPEIDNDNEIDLKPDDVRVDTYRSSGAGGQHVNKTESAIRLTHLPTGIVVTCQNERSQTQNRETAYKILRARLLERKLEQEAQERSDLKGNLKAAGFGSRIRSYVLQPYTQVTDHRTETSVGDANAVLDGGLQPFIDAYLHYLITPEEVAS